MLGRVSPSAVRFRAGYARTVIRLRIEPIQDPFDVATARLGMSETATLPLWTIYPLGFVQKWRQVPRNAPELEVPWTTATLQRNDLSLVHAECFR